MLENHCSKDAGDNDRMCPIADSQLLRDCGEELTIVFEENDNSDIFTQTSPQFVHRLVDTRLS